MFFNLKRKFQIYCVYFRFQLPGGKLGGNEDDIELSPISGELNQWGIFTSTLAETLEELQTISGL